MARLMGARLLAWQLEAPWWIRHPVSAAWTSVWLVALRPRRIVLQHSFLLGLVVAAYKRLAPWPVLVIDDCHTKALRRRPSGMLRPFYDVMRAWSMGSFDCLVIATATLEEEARTLGVPIVVIPDPLPHLAARAERGSLRGRDVVVVIGSYAEDEPVAQIMEAAERLPEVHFKFTGRPPAPIEAGPLPGNVELLGFLPPESFVDELAAADALVALTTHDGTFLRAACEAVAIGRPLVTSGTEALRAYLSDAAVYVDADAGSIAEGVARALVDRRGLEERVTARRRELRERENVALTTLRGLLRPSASRVA